MLLMFSEQSQEIWSDAERDLPGPALSNGKLQSVSSVFEASFYINHDIADNNFPFILIFMCRYGYLTNTKVKFILVTTDLDVKDADVRNVSRNIGEICFISIQIVLLL